MSRKYLPALVNGALGLASQLERDYCGEKWREADVLGVELRQAPPECGSAVSSAHPQLSSPLPPQEGGKAIWNVWETHAT